MFVQMKGNLKSSRHSVEEGEVMRALLTKKSTKLTSRTRTGQHPDLRSTSVT